MEANLLPSCRRSRCYRTSSPWPVTAIPVLRWCFTLVSASATMRSRTVLCGEAGGPTISLRTGSSRRARGPWPDDVGSPSCRLGSGPPGVTVACGGPIPVPQWFTRFHPLGSAERQSLLHSRYLLLMHIFQVGRRLPSLPAGQQQRVADLGHRPVGPMNHAPTRQNVGACWGG